MTTQQGNDVMSFPQLTFQVRTRSHATLAEMGRRVGAILGCRFEPSADRMFEDGEALEASALGLQITLSHEPDSPEGSLRTFILMGALRADIEARWEIDVPQISIGPYVLGLLTVADGDGWYIATLEEQLAEAGLAS